MPVLTHCALLDAPLGFRPSSAPDSGVHRFLENPVNLLFLCKISVFICQLLFKDEDQVTTDEEEVTDEETDELVCIC